MPKSWATAVCPTDSLLLIVRIQTGNAMVRHQSHASPSDKTYFVMVCLLAGLVEKRKVLNRVRVVHIFAEWGHMETCHVTQFLAAFKKNFEKSHPLLLLDSITRFLNITLKCFAGDTEWQSHHYQTVQKQICKTSQQ